MKQGVTVSAITGRDSGLNHFFKEKRADFFHRAKQRFVAFDPRDIIGPTAALHVKAVVFLPELLDDFCQSLRPLAGFEPVPDALLTNRLERRQILLANARGKKMLQIFRHIHGWRIRRGTFAHHFKIFGRKFIHHHAAILAIGDLGHQRRDLFAGQFHARKPLGLVVGLHLGNQLGVAALSLNDRDDRGFLASRAPAHQPMGHVFALRTVPILRMLHSVFLHQDPLESAILQGLYKFIGGIGMVGQRHFRRGKASHTAQGLEPENGGEMLLPGQHVQPIILDGRGWRYGMTPGAAKPFRR